MPLFFSNRTKGSQLTLLLTDSTLRKRGEGDMEVELLKFLYPLKENFTYQVVMQVPDNQGVA